MKPIFLVLLILCRVSTTFSQPKNEDNVESIAIADFKKEEAKMQSKIHQIRKSYKSATLTMLKFNLAQKAWEKYRDAELQARFPPEERFPGTNRRMCYFAYKSELTRERTKKLSVWVSQFTGFDICSGAAHVPKNQVHSN